VNLRTQKRLASSVIGCGKRKIWLDPNEQSEISNANSRQTIRKLISDGLIIRKPGAAVFTSLVASIVSALLGTSWGVWVVLYGLLQGLAPELVFLATRYRRFALPVALLAAAAAGATAASLDWFYWYRDWAAHWIAAYYGGLITSAIVIAGVGSWYLVQRMALTGVLDAFPSGRERTAL
jgi:energy-coupling factor transport system substrate-specific component